MSDTTKRTATPGDETTVMIPPNGIFLGASETDMIALEREELRNTTVRRKAGEPPRPELNSG